MIKETSITIETSVVREREDYFVRVSYEGKQRLQFGPINDKFTAHDLCEAISRSARATLEFFLETQQFPVKVPA
jgi:hypothetical protein